MDKQIIIEKAKYEVDEREVLTKLKAYKTASIATLLYIITISLIFTIVENTVNMGPMPLYLSYQSVALIIIGISFFYITIYNLYMYLNLKWDGSLFKILLFGVLFLSTVAYLTAVIV